MNVCSYVKEMNPGFISPLCNLADFTQGESEFLMYPAWMANSVPAVLWSRSMELLDDIEKRWEKSARLHKGRPRFTRGRPLRGMSSSA